MKKPYTRLIVAGMALAIGLGLNLNLNLAAEDAPPPPPSAGKSQPGAGLGEGRKLPFHGKLSAVDREAKTIRLVYTTGEKTYHITTDTLILKNDQPATLADAEIGNQVSGSYVRQKDRMEVTKLNLSRKPVPSEDKGRKAAKESRPPKEPATVKVGDN